MWTKYIMTTTFFLVLVQISTSVVFLCSPTLPKKSKIKKGTKPSQSGLAVRPLLVS